MWGLGTKMIQITKTYKLNIGTFITDYLELSTLPNYPKVNKFIISTKLFYKSIKAGHIIPAIIRTKGSQLIPVKFKVTKLGTQKLSHTYIKRNEFIKCVPLRKVKHDKVIRYSGDLNHSKYFIIQSHTIDTLHNTLKHNSMNVFVTDGSEAAQKDIEKELTLATL